MPRKYITLGIDDYTITTKGEVINNHTKRSIKPQINGKGYYRVCIGGKLKFVHRLVAERYIPNPEHKPQVNHKDGNKLNNCVENLEWVSNLENRKHAIKNGLHLTGEKCSYSKLTKSQVIFIRNHTDISNLEYAKLFNVHESTISDVKMFRTWKNS